MFPDSGVFTSYKLMLKQTQEFKCYASLFQFSSAIEEYNGALAEKKYIPAARLLEEVRIL